MAHLRRLTWHVNILNDRHGVMIVGDPMSAKTKAYMLLAETLTTMSERKIPEHHEFRVRNMSSQIPPMQ